MANLTVDLRSDTVTQPSEAMREAMHHAPLGDDVYGEDPTVRALEERAAALTGKAAGLFVPSGSMANLIAQLIYVRRGDEVLLGQGSHILFYESGSGAALAGCLYNVVPDAALIRAADVTMHWHAGSFYAPRTALVWVENSHNRAGGAVYPLEQLAAISAACRDLETPLHLDGARVFNAATALGQPVEAIARHVDSLSFCLSKGLGAPVGTVLVGSATFRDAALRFRKMLGGAMRQAGVLAAAGLFALEHNLVRLADDHRRAQRLAQGLAAAASLRIDPQRVVTNLLLIDLPAGRAAALCQACRAEGVLFSAVTPSRVRLVTHLDVDDAGIARAIEVIGRQAERLFSDAPEEPETEVS